MPELEGQQSEQLGCTLEQQLELELAAFVVQLAASVEHWAQPLGEVCSHDAAEV